jgi:hypothetical protein
LGNEGRNSNFIQKESLFKNFHCNLSLLLSHRNFPSKAEREASTDRISQFQDPSLRKKNPHFYKKFLWQGKEQFLTLINSQLIKYMGVFFLFGFRVKKWF